MWEVVELPGVSAVLAGVWWALWHGKPSAWWKGWFPCASRHFCEVSGRQNLLWWSCCWPPNQGTFQVVKVINCLKCLPFHCDRQLWVWLVHHFGLLCTDGEPEVVTSWRASIHVRLYCLLWAGIDSTVVSEEKSLMTALSHFRHFASAWSWTAFRRFYIWCICHKYSPEMHILHCSKHHAKECWDEDTALTVAVCDWEGVRWFPIVQNLGLHTIMELVSDFGAAKLCHDLPESPRLFSLSF